jgi:hypothetical protein
MSRLKVMVLSLCAVAAVTAVTAASASAAHYVVEGTTVTSPTETTSVIGESTLTSKILGTEIVIQCKKGKSKEATIESGGASKGILVYEECKVTKPSGCGVSSTLTTKKVSDSLVETGGVVTADKFTGEGSGEEYIEIEITTCSLKGKYKVKGTQECKTDNEKEEVTHTLTCEASGSKLKLGSESATYTGKATVSLASGKKWAAVKG